MDSPIKAPWRRRALALFGALALLGAIVATAPTAFANPSEKGEPLMSRFEFGLWGDAPYAKNGDGSKISGLTDDMNRARLAFSVFDGDIKDGSSLCTNDQYSNAISRFNAFRAPMIYVPGDNEWTDCHRTNNGGNNNLERLDYIRQTMFVSSASFGQKTLRLQHQGPLGGQFAENTRWSYGPVVFVGLNVPGSNNNKVNALDATDCMKSSARTVADCQADNAEYAARDAADIAWLHSSFEVARSTGARGVMVVIQADPGFDLPETAPNERVDPAFDGYTNFLNALLTETRAFDGEVVLVHGDTHFFKVDKPLVDQAHLVPNFTRVETFGSPNVHWVKVTVDPRSRSLFSFEPMIVPGN